MRKILLAGCVALGVSLLLSGPASAMTTYTVKRGDSLWGIAARHRPSHKVSVPNMIKAIQKLNSDSLPEGSINIHPGENLQVPSTLAEVQQALGGKAASSQTESVKSAATKAAQNGGKNHTPPFREHPHSTPAQANQDVVNQLRALATQAQKAVMQAKQENAELTSQLQQSQKQAAELKGQVNNLQGKGHFPWAWLWFILFVIAVGVFWYQQKKRDAGTGRGAAASRLGLGTGNPSPKKARRMNMHDYTNLSEELQSYPVQAGDVVKPREPEHEEVMDSMMQIDVEIAQGNYSAAERLIKGVLGKDKSNVPYRMKLLELYAMMDNKREFNKVSEYMLKHLVSEQSEEWKKVRKMYLQTWVYD